jgi:hypothetical protein
MCSAFVVIAERTAVLAGGRCVAYSWMISFLEKLQLCMFREKFRILLCLAPVLDCLILVYETVLDWRMGMADSLSSMEDRINLAAGFGFGPSVSGSANCGSSCGADTGLLS